MEELLLLSSSIIMSEPVLGSPDIQEAFYFSDEIACPGFVCTLPFNFAYLFSVLGVRVDKQELDCF